MKRKLLLCLAVVFFACDAFATTHTIIVADYTFSPSSLTFQIGDTIKWVWSSGTHTTTSTTIPGSATSWNATISSTTTTFIYVPTVAGTYNYQCNFHVSMGMTGSFTVATSAVPEISNTTASVILYPNPVSSLLHLNMPPGGKQARVTVSDVTGKELINNIYTVQNIDLDLSSLRNGIYFVRVVGDKVSRVEKLVITH